MSIVVEYGYGVTGIVEIGMSSVFSPGVHGLVSIYVPTHDILGAVASIAGAVYYVLPVIYSVLPGRVLIGSYIYVLNKLRLKWKV